MSNKYWENREIQRRKYALDRAISQLNEELKRCYQYTTERILRDIEKLYIEIMEDSDGKVLVSHLYSYNRYYELLNNINTELRKLGLKEQVFMKQELERVYIQNQAIIGASFNLSSEINYQEVEMAINDIWLNDGKNWSDRIWADKEKLSERLRENIIDCLAAGASPARLEKELITSFNVSFHNAQTLARTELAHIQNVSTLDKYKKDGIEEVRILVDKNCCDECNENKGKIFPVIDAPTLPIHPNCKCTYVAIIK